MNNPKIYWLVSYPKSGNTWCRVFLSNYIYGGGNSIDINQLNCIPFASSRFFLDKLLGVESSELTKEETDEFRLEAFRILQKESNNFRIIKAHDSFPEKGNPNFFSDDVTAGVIYIVRNPFDIVCSLANHMGESIENSIKHINDDNFSFCNNSDKLEIVFPQKLKSWSGHVISWLDKFKGDLHLVRYEDLSANPYKYFKGLIDFLHLDFHEENFQRSLEASSFEYLKRQERQTGFKEKSPKTKTFFREGKSGTWKKYLNEKQISEISRRHCEVMKRLNYLDTNGNILI
jgi:hypothetical protein